MRRAAKRDTSEAAIVEYLRKAGWSWMPISGRDYPDGIGGKCGVNVLIENKTGNRPLRPGQARFMRDWNGDPPYILRCVADAIALNEAISKLGRRIDEKR